MPECRGILDLRRDGEWSTLATGKWQGYCLRSEAQIDPDALRHTESLVAAVGPLPSAGDTGPGIHVHIGRKHCK